MLSHYVVEWCVCVMCGNAFLMCFCCPCMTIYWVFANICAFLLMVMRLMWNLVCCTACDTSADLESGGLN